MHDEISGDSCQVRLEPSRHPALHAELDSWRENVGSPIAIDAGPVAPPRLDGIDVLCWNIAIGRGRLDELLVRLRDTGDIGTRPERPLIVLAQEAFREDDTVPGAAASLHHGGAMDARHTRDSVIAMAERAGLSLRYSPSMRNGHHPSDRGNAILSTVRLAAARAFVLPYVRQRRVAVTSTIAGHPITFVSAHLDTHGVSRGERRKRVIGAGRVRQAQALARELEEVSGSVILGADLNSILGVSDPAVRALVAAGLHPARRAGAWRHTFHRPLRLLLDHVMFRSQDHTITGVTVTRIDEVEGDRSPTVFGSDHHPLLARVHLATT